MQIKFSVGCTWNQVWTIVCHQIFGGWQVQTIWNSMQYVQYVSISMYREENVQYVIE